MKGSGPSGRRRNRLREAEAQVVALRPFRVAGKA